MASGDDGIGTVLLLPAWAFLVSWVSRLLVHVLEFLGLGRQGRHIPWTSLQRLQLKTQVAVDR